MKLLIDMNLSPLWVQFLADSGFDSIHWSNIGQPSGARPIGGALHRMGDTGLTRNALRYRLAQMGLKT